MTARMALMFVALVFAPGDVVAQNADQDAIEAPVQNAALTRADFEAYMMQLETRLEAKINQTVETKVNEKVAALERRVATLEDAQKSGEQLLSQIIRTDNEGNHLLRIGRIDASHEPTKQAFRESLEAVVPEGGTVIIRNKTDSLQHVSVDGQTITVLARDWTSVPVKKRQFVVRTSNNRTLHWGFEFPKTKAVVNIVYATPTAQPINVPAYFAQQ